LNNYNPNIIAVAPGTIVMKVYLSLNISDIILINSSKGLITTLMFLDMYWTDSRLFYNPSNWTDINSLTVDNSNIWVPDL